MSAKTKTAPPMGTQALYRQAQIFGSAAEAIGRHSLTTELPIFFMPPIAVCWSFALEQALKCLLLLEKGAYPTEHHHRKLFDELSSESQQAIEISYNKLVARPQSFIQQIKKHKPDFDESLDTMLDECGDAFVQYRYVYESKSSSFYGVHEAFLATRERIIGIRPDWGS
jgi:hypothetical protein